MTVSNPDPAVIPGEPSLGLGRSGIAVAHCGRRLHGAHHLPTHPPPHQASTIEGLVVPRSGSLSTNAALFGLGLGRHARLLVIPSASRSLLRGLIEHLGRFPLQLTGEQGRNLHRIGDLVDHLHLGHLW